MCEAKVPTDEAAAAGGAAAVGAVIGADEAHAKRACPRARCSVFVLIYMCVSASVSVGLLFLYVSESVYVLLLARNLNLMRCFESYDEREPRVLRHSVLCQSESKGRHCLHLAQLFPGTLSRV